MNLARLYSERVCPACGNQLDFTPWSGGVKEQACLCCGLHFGHDDADPVHREGKYRHWRRIWISYGKRWWRGEPPPNFNPDEQLQRLETLADDQLERPRGELDAWPEK